MGLQGITIFCFAASYAVAFGLEIWQLLRPIPAKRFAMLGFAAAGLFAQTLFLFNHGQPFGGQPVTLLFLSWILAVFYIYGSLHHRRIAWGVFVLPVVLGLVAVAWLMQAQSPSSEPIPLERSLANFVVLHVTFLILGAVGVCVGFVASVMYLVQARKLKHKSPPSEGLRLLSLERLEEMNRRAINGAFPLFTAGLLIGMFLWKSGQFDWFDPKVIATAILWLAFVVLLYLRYGLHVQGRRVAWGTIAAFLILLTAFTVHFYLPSAHRFGGAP